jgi:hypothetical protein
MTTNRPSETAWPDDADTYPADIGPTADFWDARQLLMHVHDFARARRSSPWAVLGVVLARVAAVAPPRVVLPAMVGGQASLNPYVGLVGPAGAGKGAAEAAAADAIQLGDVEVGALGSGEGLVHLFMRRLSDKDGGGQVQHHEAVLLSVPEIDTLTALGARQGATLLPELRKAYMGERLGFGYADPKKRLSLSSHAYRLALVVGIQPERALALLSDSDAGTPQRFLWMPATDAGAPEVAPACPKPWRWKAPEWPPEEFFDPRTDLGVCRAARDLIDTERVKRLRGEGDALDGHALLARLKVAALLGILDGRLEVSDADWQLADVVMRVSLATRNSVAVALHAVSLRRTEAEAARAATIGKRVAKATEEVSVERTANNIVRKLRAAGNGLSHSELRRQVPARDREHFDEAIDVLHRKKWIKKETVEYQGQEGVRYVLK